MFDHHTHLIDRHGGRASTASPRSDCGRDGKQQHDGHSKRNWRCLTLVTSDEVHAYQRARQGDGDQDEPVVGVTVGHRVVIAGHDEQHGQRKVRIVHRALLAANPVDGIRRVAPLCGGDHATLARYDHEKHVRHHDRPQHRTEMLCKPPDR